MDSGTASLITEIVKSLLYMGFNLLKHAGKTDEEIESILIDSRREFFRNAPSNLPDPNSGDGIEDPA